MYGLLMYVCIMGTVFIAVLLSVWTGGLWMHAQAMCNSLVVTTPFLCSVFIMPQASATTATTTTPPVAVVSSGTFSLLMNVTMAPTLMGLPATLGQNDVGLPPLLILRDTRGVVGLATVPLQ